jgi:ectoine hydroxylase-related dioxygenase (phytanoyl-CoA dioxygenase family)
MAAGSQKCHRLSLISARKKAARVSCVVVLVTAASIVGWVEPFAAISGPPTAYRTRYSPTCLDALSSDSHDPQASMGDFQQKKKRPRNEKPSVQELVSKMGLTPVPKTKTPTTAKEGESIKTIHPSLRAQLDYARDGHTVLRKYIDPSRLDGLREKLSSLGNKEELKAWRQKVEVVAGSGASILDTCRTIHDCRSALDRLGIPSNKLPFLQYFNTWRSIPAVYDLALDLAETAAILLDVPSVRLYQDSFFWKRSIDGPTPWHVDARMAPFDTPHMLTLWIPLHKIDYDGSALHFVSKSHSDFALPFWNPYEKDSNVVDNAWNQLEKRYQHNQIEHYMPLAKGDITIHSGWTLHSADGQESDRLALAISYVDARAPIRAFVLTESDHGDDEDRWSYADWVKDVPAGKEFDHPLVPIVWPRKK